MARLAAGNQTTEQKAQGSSRQLNPWAFFYWHVMSINHRSKYRPRKRRRDWDKNAKPKPSIHAWGLAKQMEDAQAKNDRKEYYRLRDILYSQTP